MSRLITLTNGQQVRGCKNYAITPNPDLVIDTRVELSISLDTDALQEGTPLSLYVQGSTANTQTPIRVWVNGLVSGSVEITPTQFRTGYRLDSAKASSGRGPLVLNVTAGSYTLQRLALMMSDEMDESHVTERFDEYYS
ncbi:hypothetical protein [Bifidobacterium pseudolongum]|uniref:hypothetical protein n=1 Tax=Bifidobacterium pseudolongum TaxID=1694 RepID=UPI001021A4C6|nr:hypothetical protein [Bifidobacterium pseudolongum]RYQ55825.1 hypothetical protein PG1616B_1041 [Bifidobacterium pseudolongum subsp. globosum]